MSVINNSTCSICNTPYYVCQSCKETIKLQPWKIHTDTPECYKVFQIIHGYSTGVYNIAEAKTKLQNVNLNNMKNFRENIKSLIEKIMAYEDVAEDTTNGNTEKVIEQTTTPKKRSRKK